MFHCEDYGHSSEVPTEMSSRILIICGVRFSHWVVLLLGGVPQMAATVDPAHDLFLYGNLSNGSCLAELVRPASDILLCNTLGGVKSLTVII